MFWRKNLYRQILKTAYISSPVLWKLADKVDMATKCRLLFSYFNRHFTTRPNKALLFDSLLN